MTRALRRTELLGREREWQPQIGFGGKAKARRQHSPDGARPPVERDRAPQDLPITAEAPLPQAVTQHDRIVLPRLMLLRQEDATVEWRRAQHGKPIGGNDCRAQTF